MDNDIFGGFSAVAQSLSDKALDDANDRDTDDDDDDQALPGPDDISKDLGKNDKDFEPDDNSNIPIKNRGDDTDDDDLDDDDLDDDDKPASPVKDTDDEPLPPKSPKDDDDNISDLGESEGDIAEFLQEKLYEGFGFEMGDTKFKSVQEVVDFVGKVVESNSAPDFANEETGRIDEYVRNGGDLRQYMDNVYGSVDVENVDIENANDQKALVRENLKMKGYSEARVKRSLERYEDAGTLQEEAEDAKEMLQEYNEGLSEKLLADQEKSNVAIREQQQKYIGDVEQAIDDLENVRGITITKAEKKKLKDYIFKPTRDGQTEYQKDYVKKHNNMIESAFFTMKGDALVEKVQKKASSDAAKRLRKKLANKGNRGKNQNTQGGKDSDIWGSISSQLRSPF